MNSTHGILNVLEKEEFDGQNQKEILQWLLNLQYFIISFVSPGISIIGIINNILIMIIMTTKGTKLNYNARIYYVAIAAGDLGSLMFSYIRSFLTDGLWYITKGQFHLTIEDPIICKFIYVLFVFNFLLSTYGVIAFTIERNFALYFPFKHKVCMTPKRVFILLCCCVLFPFVVHAPISFVSITSLYLGKGQLPVCYADPKSSFYGAFAITSMVFNLISPPILTSIFVIAIVYKIIQAKTKKFESFNNQKGISKSEMKTVLTLLSVAMINILIFFPITIFFGGSFLLRAIAPNSFIRNIWESLGRIGYQFSSLSHSLNFFVYLIQIQSFRRKLFCQI